MAILWITAAPTTTGAPLTATPQDHDRRQRLQQLCNRFIGINMRSRSLRLARTTKSGAFDLHRLRQHAPDAFKKFTAQLGVESDASVPLVEVEPHDEKLTAVVSDLSVLARAARSTWQEVGAQELAVGWPIIEGRCQDGTWIRGPILLYPVALDTTSRGRLCWQATFTGPATLNPSLVQTLARLESLKLDLEMLRKADQDGLFKIDSETWQALVTTLANHGLPLTPNQPTKLPPLAPLKPRPKDERDNLPVGNFTIRHQLILGRFPRWGSTLVNDYTRLLETNLDNTVMGLAADVLAVDEEEDWSEEQALEDEAVEQSAPEQIAEANGTDSPGNSNSTSPDQASTDKTSLDAVLDGRRRWQVLPSDASQDAVFAFLEQPDSRGLVVQGPPGTGKSQLIANLIASAIASGERVLLVCQKRAALDVVAARLESQGLRDPIALVNDVEQDRKTVCASIAHTLEPFLHQDASLTQLEQTIKTTIEDHEQALRRFDARLRQAHLSHRLLVDRQSGRPSLVELQEHSLKDDGRPLPDLTAVANETNLTEAVAL
ncbi:MAG: AAA domain-containing protein, partial [Myxococcota bacterium]